jgi:hypothetical protein
MESSLASVPDGTFAVEFPACPHPGRNLPEGWDQAPETVSTYATPLIVLLLRMIWTFFRWLHSCFLAVDVNFCLKFKNRGISDPEIGSGWSYFVGNQQYNERISLPQ